MNHTIGRSSFSRLRARVGRAGAGPFATVAVWLVMASLQPMRRA